MLVFVRCQKIIYWYRIWYKTTVRIKKNNNMKEKFTSKSDLIKSPVGFSIYRCISQNEIITLLKCS